ncbi:hypothetical protein DFP72DRAFT_1077892 [Ephemerocybe angulata]|uniref:Uncharacterized protein n=1 Tax=Ephemerocybe angulata TaxID=980116 RepID=A0A8H6LV34_9AGAR|nr:hypothetical protein DFP72DRAFT_1077892 [Tulosesus angulatus]
MESLSYVSRAQTRRSAQGANVDLPEPKLYLVRVCDLLAYADLVLNIDVNDIPVDRHWTPKAKSQFIESVYKNTHIEPFVLASIDVTQPHTCLDGRERLFTLIERTYGRYWYTSAGTKRRKLISNVWKERFLAKQIIMITYRDISPIIAAERLAFTDDPDRTRKVGTRVSRAARSASIAT